MTDPRKKEDYDFKMYMDGKIFIYIEHDNMSLEDLLVEELKATAFVKRRKTNVSLHPLKVDNSALVEEAPWLYYLYEI
jgi:hypothetical protein